MSRVDDLACDAFMAFVVLCLVIGVSLAMFGIAVLTLHLVGVSV